MVKAKTARRKLARMNVRKMVVELGIRKTTKVIKPYMRALKKDIKNPASARAYYQNRIRFFG